jgi:hypothetical protein
MGWIAAQLESWSAAQSVEKPESQKHKPYRPHRASCRVVVARLPGC